MNKKVLQKKLSSNEGASLMVALLFFVMCATVGSVILAAATASSGRLAVLMESDQRYLAVSSAANMITEMISGKNEDGKTDPAKIITLEATYDDSGNSDEIYYIKDDSTDPIPLNNAVSESVTLKLLKNIIFGDNKLEQMQDTFTTSQYSKFNDDEEPFSVTGCSITFSEYPALDVKMTFTMNHDLDLLVEFYQENSEEEKVISTKLLFKAIKECKILGRAENEPENPDDPADPEGESTTQTKYHFLVNWDNPVIYYGTVE